ncbi:hypothetical protein ACFPM0_07210 [Pseudonocardia sulfidoxydans]|uniref:hypothetical protein n=1 Tax=Pseudonocardia sulfidoxydans TaxID=54011 RepID=UPI00360CDFFE
MARRGRESGIRCCPRLLGGDLSPSSAWRPSGVGCHGMRRARHQGAVSGVGGLASNSIQVPARPLSASPINIR